MKVNTRDLLVNMVEELRCLEATAQRIGETELALFIGAAALMAKDIVQPNIDLRKRNR